MITSVLTKTRTSVTHSFTLKHTLIYTGPQQPLPILLFSTHPLVTTLPALAALMLALKAGTWNGPLPVMCRKIYRALISQLFVLALHRQQLPSALQQIVACPAHAAKAAAHFLEWAHHRCKLLLNPAGQHMRGASQVHTPIIRRPTG